MTATIVPETLRFARGSSSKIQANFGEAQRLWTPANFELRLDGFGEATRRVTKIDGFTIKQQVHEYHAGNLRDPVRVPGLLEFPNLSFYVPEADAQVFIDHYTKHGIEGNPQAPTRHTGSIVCLDNAGEELCTVTLKGVDIAHIAPEKQDASSEEIKLVKVEVAVEDMKFEYKSAAIG
jgi:hypothetical protein